MQGNIINNKRIGCKLSNVGSISSNVKIADSITMYEGSYIIQPTAHDQKIYCAGMEMRNDITILSIPIPQYQTKSVSYTPTLSEQTESITADSGFDALSNVNVTVSAMPLGNPHNPSWQLTSKPDMLFLTVTFPNLIPGYIDSINSTSHGILYQYETVTPTETQQTIEPQSVGYYLKSVTINAIPSNYIGSAITQRDSTDITKSGATVNVPSGFYAENASATIDSGSVTAPASISGTGATITSGTNTLTFSKTVSVTPSVTQSGYITAGTASNSAVSLTASVNTRTSSDLSANGATVTAPAGYYENAATKTLSSGSVSNPTATKSAVSNHSVSVTPSVSYTGGYISSGSKNGTAVTVTAAELVSGSETKTSNGTFDVTNLAEIVVNVSGGGTSSWELLASASLTVSTTSTSAASAGTVAAGSAAYTKDAVIYVRIRGNSGKRNGYFYGSDTIFVNSQKANGSTTAFSAPAVEYIRVNNDGTYTTSTGSYGVYGYSINSSGTVTIRRRYNSTNTLTINDTFTVEVYKLTLPTGKALFS